LLIAGAAVSCEFPPMPDARGPGIRKLKDWRRSLLWAAFPPLLLLAVGGMLAVINWAYESKLCTVRTDSHDWVQNDLGLLLLATALAFATFASAILFVVRILGPDSKPEWYMFTPLLIVTILLIFPALFIVVLGPAGITIMQSMRPAP
jgi:hypothetical protein